MFCRARPDAWKAQQVHACGRQRESQALPPIRGQVSGTLFMPGIGQDRRISFARHRSPSVAGRRSGTVLRPEGPEDARHHHGVGKRRGIAEQSRARRSIVPEYLVSKV